MSATMTVPELGENLTSVEVVRILVAVGDSIVLDQPVIAVETDKAAVEVPSSVSGVVSEIHVGEGDSIGVGDPILTVEVQALSDTGSPAEDTEGPGRSVSEAKGDPDEGTAKEHGQSSAPEQPSSAPPSTDLGSEIDGDAMVPRWRGRPGPAKLVPAAPSVRRLAREIGVDISDVQGSGPGGRLTIDDVKAHAHRLLSSTAASGIPTSSPDLPDLSRWGEISEEPLSKVRRLTAERMAHAWLSVPQVTHYDVADITELEELRRRYRDRVAEVGGALTLTAILAKVVAAALRVFPRFNSALDVRRALLLRRHNVHIGVAVDTEHGLLVPVIRDADTKSITRIAIELSDLAERTRSRKVMPDELQGGSFSISNLGGIGGTAFSPIVNWPEVAILGISRASIQPKWSDSEMRPRLMAPLSLSYDHRVIDGAEAARFVRWIAEALEEPLLLVLE